MAGNDASASAPRRPAKVTCAVVEPPSPTGVRSLDELVTRLNQLRAWSGLGYRELHRRVIELRRRRGVPERLSFDTVYRCMQPGRRRLDVELVVDIARVLLGDATAAATWRMAHQVISGRAGPGSCVYSRPCRTTFRSSPVGGPNCSGYSTS